MEQFNKDKSKSAVISLDGQDRYFLSRKLNDNSIANAILFIMLNPSTADFEKDDATIRRCVSFSKNLGYGNLWVCNIYGFRATNPKELLKAKDPFVQKIKII